MSLYQLFVKSEEQSAIRVKVRYNEGGAFINTDEVRTNFNANLNNVANQYFRFDHSYFIDNSTKKEMKLSCEFKKALLVQYNASDHFYLRELFQKSALTGKISKYFLKIIQTNRDYPKSLRPGLPGRRLRF